MEARIGSAASLAVVFAFGLLDESGKRTARALDSDPTFPGGRPAACLMGGPGGQLISNRPIRKRSIVFAVPELKSVFAGAERGSWSSS